MSISGRLDDVSIAEVMQFIHLGGRSGVLHVEGTSKAEVHFHSGRIVAAQGDRAHRLGELLVSRRIIEPQTLLEAVERQRREKTGQVLGEVLLAMGAVTEEQLSEAVQAHICDTIRNVLSWNRGTFRFEMGDVEPIQGFERSLGQLLPSVNLNTQRVLMEAARILDEARRDRTRDEGGRQPETAKDEPTPAAKAGTSQPARPKNAAVDRLFTGDEKESATANGHRSVFILSSDDDFVAELGARLARESIRLRRHRPDASELLPENGPDPVVLIDTPASATEAAIESVLAQAPAATPIAIADPSAPEDHVASLGAVAIVERDVEAVVARCTALDLEGDAGAEPSESLLLRLRRLSTEIRTGALSANATLALLNTLAECSERSVLFSVKDGALKAIGGFGFSTLNGRPIVEVIRGLTISMDDAQSLAGAVTYLEAREIDFDVDPLPGAFEHLVGRPESGKGAVFPVSGTESVILLVYTDNGVRPVEELDLMTLAADQVGVAIENEFLRYRLAQN